MPQFVRFNVQALGPSSTIDDDVPVPGSYTIRVEIPLAGAEPELSSDPTPLVGGLGATFDDHGNLQTPDDFPTRYWSLWTRFAKAAGIPAAAIAAAQPDPVTQAQADPTKMTADIAPVVAAFNDSLDNTVPQAQTVNWGDFALPVLSDSGNIAYRNFSPGSYAVAVQEFQVNIFPDRYGAGKTVRTLTLLPGEQQQLGLKTWQSTSSTTTSATSIVDSMSDDAKDSFQDQLDNSSDSATTSDSKLAWNVQASASASFFGMGSASISGGASGEQKNSTSDDVKSMSQALTNHASDSNQQRAVSVSTNDEVSADEGDESTTTRSIKNVNLRRTLNFVFRELNQVFVTIINLSDIRIGIRTGLAGDIYVTSLAHARDIMGGTADAIIHDFVRRFGSVFDDTGTPVSVLEEIDAPDWQPQQQAPAWFDALAPAADAQELVSSATRKWRFRRNVSPGASSIPERDAINQAEEPHKVPGLIVSRDEVVMRTSSVVVEALLGLQDALDDFAMRMQEANATAKETKNAIRQLGITAVNDATDKAAAFMQVFGKHELITPLETIPTTGSGGLNATPAPKLVAKSKPSKK